MIVVHAVSKSTSVPNTEVFSKLAELLVTTMFRWFWKKWLREKFIPNIPPKSVICMHNAAYHTKVLNPVPKQYASKRITCEWLHEKKIKYDEKMWKIELFELTSANSPASKNIVLMNLLKSYDQEVTRQPPAANERYRLWLKKMSRDQGSPRVILCIPLKLSKIIIT